MKRDMCYQYKWQMGCEEHKPMGLTTRSCSEGVAPGLRFQYCQMFCWEKQKRAVQRTLGLRKTLGCWSETVAHITLVSSFCFFFPPPPHTPFSLCLPVNTTFTNRVACEGSPMNYSQRSKSGPDMKVEQTSRPDSPKANLSPIILCK